MRSHLWLDPCEDSSPSLLPCCPCWRTHLRALPRPAGTNCDKAKTAAAAKGFSDFLSCSYKGLADGTCDIGACRTKAYEKCVIKFRVADAKFGGACAFTANGPDSCLDTLNAANSIFGGI